MTNLIAEHAFKKNLINVETRGLNTCLRVMARLFPVILQVKLIDEQSNNQSFFENKAFIRFFHPANLLDSFPSKYREQTEAINCNFIASSFPNRLLKVQITSYGVKLLLSISRLLFMEGYTIDKLEEGKHEYVFIGHRKYFHLMVSLKCCCSAIRWKDALEES